MFSTSPAARAPASSSCRRSPAETPPVHRFSAFDALAYLVPRARDRGFEVHAWVSALLVWSSYELPEEPNHLLRARPNLLTYSPNLNLASQWDVALHADQFRQGVYLEPSQPEARQFVLDVALEIARRYEVDGIFLDYIRYPNREIPVDEGVRTAFRREYYVDPPPIPPGPFQSLDQEAILWGTPFPDNDGSFGEFAEPVWDTPPDVTESPADFQPEIRDPETPFPLANTDDPIANERMESLYKNWVLWKARQIDKTVLTVRQKLYLEFPQIRLSAAVIPDIAHARNDLGQDWTRWVRRGWVDFVVPQFFAANTNLVRDQMRNVISAVGTQVVLPGIAIYNQEPRLAAEKIDAAVEAGFSGTAVFSYDILIYTQNYWGRLRAESRAID